MVAVPSVAGPLRIEVESLRRTQGMVLAEKDAARRAVECVLLNCNDTSGKANIDVRIDYTLPSQSLRGREKVAAQNIHTQLQNSGAWGHYAAFQFSAMLTREQEFNNDFFVVYHSYSFAALLYEVQADIARRIYGLPEDSAPIPRLSLAKAKGACTDLGALRSKGGKDHAPSFRALGLSCSCSIFAHGSEAPPLSCFSQGYSCTDLSFRQLLVEFLGSCAGSDPNSDNSDVERTVDRLIEVGARYDLLTGPYAKVKSARSQAPFTGKVALTGYMLQIFVHKSIIEQYAYPSKPYGAPIPGTFSEYVTGSDAADGQARLLFHPPTMLDQKKARIFHYCARPKQSCMSAEVPLSRGKLLKELRDALAPLLKGASPELLKKRLKL